jgi:UDP-N-acetylmuramate--alanine ligase
MKVHFIGIGGSGMRPLSGLASEDGWDVQGSDPKGGPGYAVVFKEPDAANVQGVDAVVYSSAIPESHPELRAARARASEDSGFRVYHRMEFLKALASKHDARVGIAGTHGKTSSTSLAGWIFLDLGLDPMIFAGGRPLYLQEGMRSGKGPAVFETDESDGSFLQSGANARLVLNVDRDHLDYYGSKEALQDAFQRFAREVPVSVVNGDDPALEGCGISFTVTGKPTAIYHGVFETEGDELAVFRRSDSGSLLRLGTIALALPGRHFAVNALGVFSLIDRMMHAGMIPAFSAERIFEAMRRFPGVERRLEKIAELGGQPVYDDYGHHPSEIAAVLRALRLRHKDVPIRIIFQPHRFTRTRDLALDFARVLSEADECWILPVYSSGEAPIAGIDSALIAGQMTGKVRLVTESEVADAAAHNAPVVWLFQGAGDVSAIARRICVRPSRSV